MVIDAPVHPVVHLFVMARHIPGSSPRLFFSTLLSHRARLALKKHKNDADMAAQWVFSNPDAPLEEAGNQGGAAKASRPLGEAYVGEFDSKSLCAHPFVS